MTDINRAMVLAAGLGTRIRSLAPDVPKPMIEVAGRPLLSYALENLHRGGVATAVVNVHHLADQIESFLETVDTPKIVVSDEREERLETGGGILKALPLLGDAPFFSVNTDAILLDQETPAPQILREAWNDDCDALLLLVPIEKTSGYAGVGDFSLDADGRIAPVSEDQALVFTGLQLLRPSLFAGEPVQQVSTKLFWEKARAEGRMRGVIYDGDWMHVGDPEGFAAAQARLQA